MRNYPVFNSTFVHGRWTFRQLINPSCVNSSNWGSFHLKRSAIDEKGFDFNLLAKLQITGNVFFVDKLWRGKILDNVPASTWHKLKFIKAHFLLMIVRTFYSNEQETFKMFISGFTLHPYVCIHCRYSLH